VRYFHGTASLSAARALLDGEPLLPRAFKGRRRGIPGGLRGMIYLTPDLGEACKYAQMDPLRRRDRPHVQMTVGEMFAEYDGRGFIAVAEGVDASLAVVDEDQVARIVRGVVHDRVHRRGLRGFEFLPESVRDALAAEVGLLEAIADEADAKLPTPHIDRARSDERMVRGTLISLGRAMQPLLSDGVRAALIACGCNIAVPGPVAVRGVWELPAHTMIDHVERLGDTEAIIRVHHRADLELVDGSGSPSLAWEVRDCAAAPAPRM
jgi:hypothetical protein